MCVLINLLGSLELEKLLRNHRIEKFSDILRRRDVNSRASHRKQDSSFQISRFPTFERFSTVIPKHGFAQLESDFLHICYEDPNVLLRCKDVSLRVLRRSGIWVSTCAGFQFSSSSSAVKLIRSFTQLESDFPHTWKNSNVGNRWKSVAALSSIQEVMFRKWTFKKS